MEKTNTLLYVISAQLLLILSLLTEDKVIVVLAGTAGVLLAVMATILAIIDSIDRK